MLVVHGFFQNVYVIRLSLAEFIVISRFFSLLNEDSTNNSPTHTHTQSMECKVNKGKIGGIVKHILRLMRIIVITRISFYQHTNALAYHAHS